MNTYPAFVRRAAGVVLVLGAAVAVAASTSAASPSAAPPGANLAPTKTFLLKHTSQLRGFTTRFQREANRYYALAKASDFDYAALWASKKASVRPVLTRAKALWIEGNPYYERVEGVVAGTPSLSVYDVILDAGSSAKEDPASAVPFDLKLADGRVLQKPGNLYNLTEGMLWARCPSTRPRASRPISTATARASSARRFLMRRSSRLRQTRSSSTAGSSTARAAHGSPPRPMPSPRSS